MYFLLHFFEIMVKLIYCTFKVILGWGLKYEGLQSNNNPMD